ncbi:NAD(P)/FAD-dependent oxidoreductase [Alkaliphilus peptidifermentans]|uniref:Dehydrogenase (Flavoprotein) n=1 Tax=Alkaliphilus peptidifermentans DSM 18978 TaxID=1120976 RepID=A0A1G5GUH2_9FIRM|nr:NAD(P)/FAD-dependent oxidoreductase [Alkaliphilus peptidifermentans]SCY55017.1 Dehydrogenase (flavoprotein) [Alkaliphilus peptidifermentans DSM 18978]
MYDIIMIGAGPTGCTAARELTCNGYKVLLVEKFKMPRNKSCSGVLIKKSMDLVKRYFDEDTPEFTMCMPKDNRGMVFTNDKGQEYRFEQEGLNIWRSSFDYWLATKATEAGAELRDETIALSCLEQENCVIVNLKGTSLYSEKAKLVIVCDGVVGSVKRKLIHAPQNYITTYQTFNKGSIELDHHYFYAYLQPYLSEYDAWFNVKDDYLIFGVSVKDTSKLEHYYAEFIVYMEKHHNAKIEKQEKAEKWLMPYIMPKCPVQYGKGKVLFAGETAGFLNPMGEGISAAMESGYAAAKAIEKIDLNNDLDLETVYSAYQNNTSALRVYMERQWNFVASMASTFDYMRL